MNATNGLVGNVHGYKVQADDWTNEKIDANGLKGVKIVSPFYEDGVNMNEGFVNKIQLNLGILEEVALINPRSPVISSDGLKLINIFREGKIELFPGIINLTYVSLTLKQNIRKKSEEALQIHHISKMILSHEKIRTLNLIYNREGLPDATNALLIENLPVQLLDEFLFVDVSEETQQIYGYNRNTEFLETNDLTLIALFKEISVKHLRVINLCQSSAESLNKLNQILGRSDVNVLDSFYVSATTPAIIRIKDQLVNITKITDVTIQIHEINNQSPDSRTKLDILEKRGNAYDFRIYTNAFCLLHSTILEDMESVCLQFFTENKIIFDSFASILTRSTKLKELDVRRDNGFIIAFTDRIYHSGGALVLTALHTVHVGLSALPALSNQVFQLFDLKAMEKVYVRYDVKVELITKAEEELNKLKRDMEDKHLKCRSSYERLLDRVLFQKATTGTCGT